MVELVGDITALHFLIIVQAKLRALHEYHVRLLHNVLPAPSGVDIANNIKYFSQTLLSKLQAQYLLVNYSF